MNALHAWQPLYRIEMPGDHYRMRSISTGSLRIFLFDQKNVSPPGARVRPRAAVCSFEFSLPLSPGAHTAQSGAASLRIRRSSAYSACRRHRGLRARHALQRRLRPSGWRPSVWCPAKEGSRWSAHCRRVQRHKGSADGTFWPSLLTHTIWTLGTFKSRLFNRSLKSIYFNR
jgi:hypothetical protein